MRLEFDRKVPVAEQLMRTAAAKSPGRKHNHQPSTKAKQRASNTAKAGNDMAMKARRKSKQQMADYFAGRSDTRPDLPAASIGPTEPTQKEDACDPLEKLTQENERLGLYDDISAPASKEQAP